MGRRTCSPRTNGSPKAPRWWPRSPCRSAGRSSFTASREPPSSASPAAAAARVVSARQTGNATWRLAVKVPARSKLTLRLTYLPGWHIDADGTCPGGPQARRALLERDHPRRYPHRRCELLAQRPDCGLRHGARCDRPFVGGLGWPSSPGYGAGVRGHWTRIPEASGNRRRSERRHSETGGASRTESTRSIFSLTTSEEPPGGMLTP